MILDTEVEEAGATEQDRAQPQRPLAGHADDARAALGRARATAARRVWFTGLPGAGKSTIAARRRGAPGRAGHPAFLLDGDNLRHGLNGDLGFDEDARTRERAPHRARRKPARRVGHDRARQPRQPLRRRPRARGGAARRRTSSAFLEVFVGAPLELCEQRDPKGLYARARSGELAGLTGVGAPYEAPTAPDLVLGAPEEAIEAAVERVLEALTARGVT